ncbi:hypothetical protein B296_00034062 [Ensete ventricosum]|uniref:Uncharacterized protein n=1 Tax=Ensete ventricosum TaxID=4639 RepID=A0A426XPA7_ENSVE|nr:hypothetical protein B296_00034062 [Ensete ventricosum]
MGVAPAGALASGRPCRRQLLPVGLPTGTVPTGLWKPLLQASRGQPLPQASRGLVAGWSWLAALAGCPGCSRQPPYRVPWSQLAVPAWGLAVAIHPFRWPGYHRLSPFLAALKLLFR